MAPKYALRSSSTNICQCHCGPGEGIIHCSAIHAVKLVDSVQLCACCECRVVLDRIMEGSFTLSHLNTYINTHIMIMDGNILNSISHWLYGIRQPQFIEMIENHRHHCERVNQLLKAIEIPYLHDYIDGGQNVTFEYLVNIYRAKNAVTPAFDDDVQKLLKSRCALWNPRKVEYYLKKSVVVPWNVIFESLACRLSKLNDEEIMAIGEADTIDNILGQEGLTLCKCHTRAQGIEIITILLNQMKKLLKM